MSFVKILHETGSQPPLLTSTAMWPNTLTFHSYMQLERDVARNKSILKKFSAFDNLAKLFKGEDQK